MSRLSFLDLAFFLTESTENPKHVAGLSIFKRPARSKADWVKRFYEELRTHDQIKPPFNNIINFKSFGGPRWRTADSVDIDEHLFYHRPKKALNKQQLYDYAAKLHEPVLDRSKPLWEYHVIDNVEGNRFAMYSKIHHSYADGVTISRWMMHNMTLSPKERVATAVWEQDGTGREARKEKADAQRLFKRLAQTNKQWTQVLGGISKLFAQLALEQVGLTKNAVALPFKAREETPLTGKLSAARQCSSAKISMDRIARMRKTTRCTLNHIALTCIDGAIKRYLADFDIVLDRPLSVQMPINLRDKDEQTSGNKIGIALVELAPDTDDPYTRLREIGFTLRAVRNQIDGVPAAAVSQYTAVFAVVLELIELLRLSRFLPAVSDTLVSNVPGPSQQLYMNGAWLEQLLPISTLLPGTQLNITLYSYAGTLYFGFVATLKVEKLANLGRYVEEAFDELEKSVYLQPE